ncbi:FAD-binding protein [Sinomonas terrae]|uniref:FAD-binding protein n=1 Tax=Sinomonas terrae TaxID=2908838 RepID=A0ABS9U610_9MICC|nr:FAD-binding protein [Sinomonas terrae]MCH6472128.1 FAD-binding protein [Sinomonas terrae]
MSTSPSTTSESTTAVVIGTGLSGLAVAGELSRRGVETVTVHGLESGAPNTMTTALRVTDLSSDDSAEYLQVMRHLRNHVASLGLDVRTTVSAQHLALVEHPKTKSRLRWAVRTETGVIFADAVVLTRCAHNQFRRFLADLGFSLGETLVQELAGIGLYLIGVAELSSPSTRELLRQAKAVGKAVATVSGRLSNGLVAAL